MAEISAFLTYLATRQNVSASTQNQALSALLFLYRRVLAQEIGPLGDLVRARVPRSVPVVLTRDEVRAVLGRLDGNARLVAALLYGSGLRLLETLELRVQDVDFGRSRIHVRRGKVAGAVSASCPARSRTT